MAARPAMAVMVEGIRHKREGITSGRKIFEDQEQDVVGKREQRQSRTLQALRVDVVRRRQTSLSRLGLLSHSSGQRKDKLLKEVKND